VPLLYIIGSLQRGQEKFKYTQPYKHSSWKICAELHFNLTTVSFSLNSFKQIEHEVSKFLSSSIYFDLSYDII